MIRNALFASALALGTLGAAQAADLVNVNGEQQVLYAAPSPNVVGGGVATLSGGGDNLQIAYGSPVTTAAPTGLVAEVIGGGKNAQLVYRPIAPAAAQLVGPAAQPRG